MKRICNAVCKENCGSDSKYVGEVCGSVDSFLGLIKNCGSAVEDVQECEDPGAL